MPHQSRCFHFVLATPQDAVLVVIQLAARFYWVIGGGELPSAQALSSRPISSFLSNAQVLLRLLAPRALSCDRAQPCSPRTEGSAHTQHCLVSQCSSNLTGSGQQCDPTRAAQGTLGARTRGCKRLWHHPGRPKIISALGGADTICVRRFQASQNSSGDTVDLLCKNAFETFGKFLRVVPPPVFGFTKVCQCQWIVHILYANSIYFPDVWNIYIWLSAATIKCPAWAPTLCSFWTRRIPSSDIIFPTLPSLQQGSMASPVPAGPGYMNC